MPSPIARSIKSRPGRPSPSAFVLLLQPSFRCHTLIAMLERLFSMPHRVNPVEEPGQACEAWRVLSHCRKNKGKARAALCSFGSATLANRIWLSLSRPPKHDLRASSKGASDAGVSVLPARHDARQGRQACQAPFFGVLSVTGELLAPDAPKSSSW